MKISGDHAVFSCVAISLLLIFFSSFTLCYASDEKEIHDTYLSLWNDRLENYQLSIGTQVNHFNAGSRSISRRQFIHELPGRLENTKQNHIVKGRSFVLDRFIRMIRHKPSTESIDTWFEQMVIPALMEANTVMSSAEHFISTMEYAMQTNADWIDELARIPVSAGASIGKLDELQLLYEEVAAYLTDLGLNGYLKGQDELHSRIRRIRVGLNNMDYQRWLMIALNRPGICFYLQGIRSCGH